VALDISAKHSPDFFGVLDEESYRDTLWDHRPLTDFWRIGPGTARRLHELGIHTMGELALCPDQELLYQTFGVDAEILIDHAWGIEPVTIADIKAYRPQTHSLGNAQVLSRGYSFDEALIIAKEMTDQICLELVEKGLDAESVTLSVGYEKKDGVVPPSAHGTAQLPGRTNSRAAIMEAVAGLFARTVSRAMPVRRMWVVANYTKPEGEGQLSLFSPASESPEAAAEERTRQKAILDIKRKFGKNALLKGVDLMPAATQRERNAQIGGHRSGEQL
jgi:DNA polymerase V